MSDDRETAADAELIGRLRIIEEQPLETRAEAYAAVHDELARRPEPGAATPTDECAGVSTPSSPDGDWRDPARMPRS